MLEVRVRLPLGAMGSRTQRLELTNWISSAVNRMSRVRSPSASAAQDPRGREKQLKRLVRLPDSGRGPAWNGRQSGGLENAGSNPAALTDLLSRSTTVVRLAVNQTVAGLSPAGTAAYGRASQLARWHPVGSRARRTALAGSSPVPSAD